MATSIHDELELYAGQVPAGYIKTSAFKHLVLPHLMEAAQVLRGKEIQAGNGQLSVRVVDLLWGAGTPNLLLSAPPVPRPDGALLVTLSPSFYIDMEIFDTLDSTQIVSTLRYDVRRIDLSLSAQGNKLVFDDLTIDAHRDITRTADADQILTNRGIDPLEAARVEGHLAYGVVAEAISAELGRRSEIELDRIFPSVNFGTTITLKVLDRGEALGIIPSADVSINASASCECAQGDTLVISRSETVNESPPNPAPDQLRGTGNIGGPIPPGIDPLRHWGRRPSGDGLAGLYLPLPFARRMIAETHVMPAVKLTMSGNGVIGYRASASVGFRNFSVSFDTASGGILLDVDMDISVSGYLDFQIFKGVRLPVAWLVAEQDPTKPQPHFQLGFYPVVDSTGRLSLKSTLTVMEMGGYQVLVVGVGTAFSILGAAAVFGFFIDVVLAGMVRNALPWELARRIEKALAQNEWRLLDAMPLLDLRQYVRPEDPYQVRPSSLLASVAIGD